MIEARTQIHTPTVAVRVLHLHTRSPFRNMLEYPVGEGGNPRAPDWWLDPAQRQHAICRRQASDLTYAVHDPQQSRRSERRCADQNAVVIPPPCRVEIGKHAEHVPYALQPHLLLAAPAGGGVAT